MFDMIINNNQARYCKHCGTQIWVGCDFGYCLRCIAYGDNIACKQIRKGELK
jgi:hypothetical protein